MKYIQLPNIIQGGETIAVWYPTRINHPKPIQSSFSGSSSGVVFNIIEFCFVFLSSAWIGAMAMGLNFFFGPITSALCDRFGCRIISFAGAVLSVLGLFLTSFIQDVYIMYLTYGLVWGVGSSLSFVSSIVVLGRYFDRRLALANGIATSGSGVGSLVAGPVINYLLQSVGWKNSMRILSGFANVLWVAALLFKPAKSNFEQLSKKAEEKKKLFDLSIWRNKAYVLWVTTVALFQFGYLVPFVHLVRCYFLCTKYNTPEDSRTPHFIYI